MCFQMVRNQTTVLKKLSSDHTFSAGGFYIVAASHAELHWHISSILFFFFSEMFQIDMDRCSRKDIQMDILKDETQNFTHTHSCLRVQWKELQLFTASSHTQKEKC